MLNLHPDWMNFAALTGRQQAFAAIGTYDRDAPAKIARADEQALSEA